MCFRYSIHDPSEKVMTTVSDDLQLARLEYRSNRFSLAIQFAEYWLAKHPDDGDALEIHGLSALRLSRHHAGIEALEEASLIKPLSSESSIALAVAYGAIGRHQLSKDLLMNIAINGDLDDQSLLVVAAGLEALDEPVLAMEACRQAGVICPDNAEVHYSMGLYASKCDYPTHVIESLIRHAINLDPDNLHYRIGLVSLLVRLGRKYEALVVINPFIPDRLDEVTCTCCLKRIANLFFDCDEFELAKHCAERHKALDPNSRSAGSTA